MRAGILIAFGCSLILHVLVIVGGKVVPLSRHEKKNQVLGFRVISTREKIELKAQTLKALAHKSVAPSPESFDLKHVPTQAEPPASTIATQPPQSSLFKKSIHYLEAFEVDGRAQPASEWVIHSEEIQSAESVTFQLTIYVSDEGALDDFEVIASSENETKTQLMLRELQATKFIPAMKDGHKVPSKRDVEITLDTTPIPYGIRRFFGGTQILNQ